jgi:hypothetical protein
MQKYKRVRYRKKDGSIGWRTIPLRLKLNGSKIKFLDKEIHTIKYTQINENYISNKKVSTISYSERRKIRKHLASKDNVSKMNRFYKR